MKLPTRLGIVFVLACASLPALADPLDSWLSSNAMPLRTIDATDEDFSDLEPLMAAIGNARVVMLGEPSHGAGSAFTAKVRLIRFLHQRMGFDVVAWESGLFDVRLAQAALADPGVDVAKAAQSGILAIWSRAAEAKPLFEYARATASTPRPLEMAGFDINASAPKTGEKLATEIRGFFAAGHDPALRAQAGQLAEELIATSLRIQARGEAKPTPSDLDRLKQTSDQLGALLIARRTDFAQAHASRDIDLMEHQLANLVATSTNAWHRRCCEPPTGDAAIRQQSAEWNRRGTLMATNLRWLLEKQHAGRKVLVWAHNAHLLRAHFAADWQAVHVKPQRHGMTPMGVLLAKWLKDAVYSIALTTYEGEEAWANGQKRGPIAPAPEGSLEARLKAVGAPYLFVNLRAGRGVRAHPLHTPMTLRISGYGQPSGKYGNDPVRDITQVFDGVLFIDKMAPATRLPD